jgi:hypothetical protein
MLRKNKRHNAYIKWHSGIFASHCCLGNAIIIICSFVWVSECMGMCTRVLACGLAYPACNAYAPYCIVTCGLSGSTKFFQIINGATFKNTLSYIKCAFWFSLQLLLETFLILRRIQRDIVMNVKTSLCKVPNIFSGCNKTWLCSTDFRKKPKYEISSKYVY